MDVLSRYIIMVLESKEVDYGYIKKRVVVHSVDKSVTTELGVVISVDEIVFIIIGF